MQNVDLKKLETVTKNLSQWFSGLKPDIAVVLGSGLGSYADRVPVRREESYERLGLPLTKAEGHKGLAHLVTIGNHHVVLLQGRVHYYEGHDIRDVVLPIRALTMAGVKTHIITCASGGVNKSFKPGDLVRITDHINLSGANPLRGENNDCVCPRFPDMTQAYDKALGKLAFACAGRRGFALKKGVYAMMAGPTYETPAEVRMLRTLGADMAGMSTVPEVIAARHMGARVLGLSCVTNCAAGVLDQPLSHDEVIAEGKKAAGKFADLVTQIISSIPK